MADGKTSDLGVRTVSAVVMLAVSAAALWLGGWVWAVFVGLVSVGVLWEWRLLVRGFTSRGAVRFLWNAGGFVYIAIAAAMLLLLRSEFFGFEAVLGVIGAVVATDIGAYFAGRTIGGPKIAARISPSKTWAGLGGGMVGAAGFLVVLNRVTVMNEMDSELILAGIVLAIIAQAGDFFESWMKRRAGVKDSGTLLPGHGGLFDRLDGLLAVLALGGLIAVLAGIAGLV